MVFDKPYLYLESSNANQNQYAIQTSTLVDNLISIDDFMNRIIKNDEAVESPNEFSTGYSARPIEIGIILFVIMIWALSLLKFFKNFEILRTTHYREIPYHLRQNNSVNLSQQRREDTHLDAQTNQKIPPPNVAII